ncbi:MAG: ATP-binding cassette domain-containing protein, partial [Acidimicrobiales bacterium]
MSVLVDLERIGFREPDRALFTDLSVTISDGDRLGVVGINGTGKSTLLRIIANCLEPDEGTIHRGRSVRIEFLEQRPHLVGGTVRSAIGEGWESAATLDRLGVTPQLDRELASLSGGQAKRVALARSLSAPSELLILDEPTNHLDLAGVAWLEKWLLTYQGALLIVSHDRYLLDRLTTRILELDRGSSYLHEGGYGS